MKALEKLLHPYNIESFLADKWTEKALFINAQGNKNFQSLFSWPSLNHLLNFYKLRSPQIRLAKDGAFKDENLDYSDTNAFLKQCRQGATIIIHELQKLVPEIASFVSDISYDLGIGNTISVNTYCSWPGKQGFTSHYDTHEVFIIQIDGDKEWYVFEDTHKYPLPAQTSTLFTPPDGEPYLRCILQPGDVLYIPRGHWHYALAQSQPSIHLTLSIERKTGADFLSWVVNQLHQKEEWRKNIPLLRGENDSEIMASYIDSLFQEFFNFFVNDDRDIASEYIDHLTSLEKPLPKYSLPAQVGFNIFEGGNNTKFTRPKFQKIEILEKIDETTFKIRIWHKKLILKGVNSSFIEKLMNQESFTANDVCSWLPGRDWEREVVPLLSTLVTEGFIFVDN